MHRDALTYCVRSAYFFNARFSLLNSERFLINSESRDNAFSKLILCKLHNYADHGSTFFRWISIVGGGIIRKLRKIF